MRPPARQPIPTLWDSPRPSGVALPARVCILCSHELLAHNLTEICAECRLLIANLFGRAVEERWRDLRDGEHVISERGRVARLLKVDRSHRYPRVSIGGEKRYLHQLVAEAWHGPRPDGLLVLHADDDPDNPKPENLRYGTALENAADAKRNRTKTTAGTGPTTEKGTPS